jgi:hypothetical protein
MSSPADLTRLRAATYTGRDPANLATATVDGNGMVVRIGFATTVGMRSPQAVEEAVRGAVAAALRSMNDAWLALDPAHGLDVDEEAGDHRADHRRRDDRRGDDRRGDERRGDDRRRPA